jgi:hypothetical protein
MSVVIHIQMLGFDLRSRGKGQEEEFFVDFALHNNRFKIRPFIAVLLIFSLVFSMVSLVMVKQADAKTSRLAVIASLNGDVTVKKGGGSKSYDAYEGMSLNQGDTLFTSSGASVTLNVSNGDSEITLGEDSEFNISDLAGKKSKLKMWAGSMWVKVKSLAGSNNLFEVETPTAVMGVRGTQFFVGVDPESGKSKLAVGAGVVAATVSTSPAGQGTKTASTFGIAPPPPEDEKTEAIVYPTQQLTVDSREESKNLAVKIEPLDIEAIVKSASANVIKAIIQNKASIDKENAEFIDRKKQEIANGTSIASGNSTFVVKNLEELNKVIVNLNNLVGNIAKSAADTNKVDKESLDKLIEMANKDIVDPNQKLDLNKVVPFDKTAGVDPLAEKLRLEQQKKLEAAKALKLLEEKKQQDELKKALDEVLKALENGRKALEEAKQKAIEDEKAKAEAALLKNLDEAEKAKFKENKANNTKTPTPSPTPVPVSETTPKVRFVKTQTAEGQVTISMLLKDFVDPDKQLYGAELHLVYDKSLTGFNNYYVNFPNNSVFYPYNYNYEATTAFAESPPPRAYDQSVFNVKNVSGSNQNELIFVITKYGKGNKPVTITNTELPLVEITFDVMDAGSIIIPTAGIILVNSSGNTIKPSIEGQTTPGEIKFSVGPSN